MAKIAVFDEDKYTGCGKCADMCGFINVPENGTANVDKDLCSECGDCVEVCPEKAITTEEKE